MAELVRWLSHVCDVITEPSVEAALPTMIEVQLWAAWGALLASKIAMRIRTEWQLALGTGLLLVGEV